MLRTIPIRWRLAAAVGVSMAALLVALGAVVYFRVDGALRGSVDEGLRAQSAESLSHPEDGSLLDADAQQSGMVGQVVGLGGRIVRSEPRSLPTLVSADTLAAARHGEVLTTISLGPGEHNRWRVLAAPDGEHVLVVARPLRQTEETLSHVFRGLIVAGPVGLLLATLGGYLLAAAALRPVESMRRRASAISATTPGARLPVPPSRDEIRDLALTLNEMLARLEAALEHERRFVADASHELRTPLTVMRGELESLAQDRGLTRETRETLGSVLEEVERLAEIVESLFALSRLDAGEASTEWRRFDLAELAATTAEQMSLLATDKNVNVACDSTAGVMVEGDPARLKQVIVNLLDNAIKYTPAGGRVRLSVQREPGYAVLEVTDDGIGIPAEALPHVFKRFFRVDGSRSREQGGAGLGLAIVKSICSAHGADIEVISTVGRGSTFRLRQPLAVGVSARS